MKALYLKIIGLLLFSFLCEITISFIHSLYSDYIMYIVAGGIFFGVGYIAKEYSWSRVYHFAFFLPWVFLNIFAITVNPANFPSKFPFAFFLSLVAYFISYYWTRVRLRYSLFVIWGIVFYMAGFQVVPKLAFEEHLLEDEKLKDIELTNWGLLRLDSTPMPFELAKNKVVLLNFTWRSCGQCILKQPTYEKVTKKYETNTDFFALEIDLGQFDSLEQARTFSRKYPNDLTWAYDPKNTLAYQLLFQGAPHEVLIDKKGKVRYMNAGFNGNMKLDYEERLSALINKLLNE